jgi:hypothetical protein
MLTHFIIRSTKRKINNSIKNFSLKTEEYGNKPQFIAGYNLDRLEKITKVKVTGKGWLFKTDYIHIEFKQRDFSYRSDDYIFEGDDRFNEFVRFLDIQKMKNFNTVKE